MIASAMAPVVNSRGLRRLLLLELPEQLHVVAAGEVVLLELVLQLLPHRADVHALHVGEDVQVP